MLGLHSLIISWFGISLAKETLEPCVYAWHVYPTRDFAPERVLAGRLDAVLRTAGGMVLLGNLQKEI